jgi:hypothetical protein
MSEIDESVANNEHCANAIKEGIADGSFPVEEGGNSAAWDPNNPYRNLDSSNTEIP